MTITISLEGEHALVTGASSGIGAHMAATLAAAGAVVTLAARRIERLEELRDQLRGQGAQVEAIALDVTDTPSLPDRLAATANALGTPGILVNNAGIAVTRSALDHSEDDWGSSKESVVLHLVSEIKCLSPAERMLLVARASEFVDAGLLSVHDVRCLERAVS